MLARSGRLATRPGYAFEVKWDGFRALLFNEHDFRVVSRLGWNMTPLLRELEGFPVRGAFDRELVAFNAKERPLRFLFSTGRFFFHRLETV